MVKHQPLSVLNIVKQLMCFQEVQLAFDASMCFALKITDHIDYIFVLFLFATFSQIFSLILLLLIASIAGRS
jgi:hypothetical protein